MWTIQGNSHMTNGRRVEVITSVRAAAALEFGGEAAAVRTLAGQRVGRGSRDPSRQLLTGGASCWCSSRQAFAPVRLRRRGIAALGWRSRSSLQRARGAAGHRRGGCTVQTAAVAVLP